MGSKDSRHQSGPMFTITLSSYIFSGFTPFHDLPSYLTVWFIWCNCTWGNSASRTTFSHHQVMHGAHYLMETLCKLVVNER
jgi:hypothetical protein